MYNTEFKIDAKWEPVAGAKLYFVQIENDDNAKKLHLVCIIDSLKISLISLKFL